MDLKSYAMKKEYRIQPLQDMKPTLKVNIHWCRSFSVGIHTTPTKKISQEKFCSYRCNNAEGM